MLNVLRQEHGIVQQFLVALVARDEANPHRGSQLVSRLPRIRRGKFLNRLLGRRVAHLFHMGKVSLTLRALLSRGTLVAWAKLFG